MFVHLLIGIKLMFFFFYHLPTSIKNNTYLVAYLATLSLHIIQSSIDSTHGLYILRSMKFVTFRKYLLIS